MNAEQTLMHREAAESPDVAERQLREHGELMRALGRRLRTLDPSLVITCARGSSDHAATFAKYLIETRIGVPVASFAPSTASIYHSVWHRLDGALFIAISQSGRSPDLLASTRAAREAGAWVIALVNDTEAPLATIADIAVPMLAGPERSVAATKSFVASLLALTGLVAAWREDADLATALTNAPKALARAWALDWSMAVPVLSNATSLFVIGRGLSLGVAQEAALKLKETCALHAEAYSAAEVKHGPMAIVKAGFPVLMLPPSDEARSMFGPIATDFDRRGALLLAAGDVLPVLPGLDAVLAPIALIQSFYRLAATLSVARGLDPDRPPHLDKVTITR